MKRFFYALLMLIIAGLTYYGCQEQTTQPDNNFSNTKLFALAGNPDEFDLKVNGTTKIGIVQVWDDGTNLYIKYIIDAPWCFTETEVKAALSDLSSATPITHTEFDPCTEDLFTIPLSTFGTDLCGSNVLISAEATVENCNGFNIFGIESATGPGQAKVYMVDLFTKIVSEDFSVRPTTYTSTNMSPNSLAYDPLTKRMYYADLNKTTSQADQSMLYFYDYNTATEYDAGLLPAGEYACADFYEGNMFLIEDNSDDLYKVTFNADGTISTAAKIADITGGTLHRWGFYGDLSIKNGILYGWASNYAKGTPGSAGTYELFQYNVSTLSGFSFVVPAYQKSLQNSFGSDGILYGHRASNSGGDVGQFYPIDLDDGSLGTAITFTAPDNRLYNDLTTAPVCYEVDAWVPAGENNYFTYSFNCYETAWGGNSAGGGNAWWWYFIVGTSPQTLYADGNISMGTVTYDGTNLTITLNTGWSLVDIPEAVKIQGYTSLASIPTKRPAAGLFTTYKGTDLVIPLSGYVAFAIHLNVVYDD